ncbi:MAG: T9SS type A sorting domain-containing protein [bacterium]
MKKPILVLFLLLLIPPPVGIYGSETQLIASENGRWSDWEATTLTSSLGDIPYIESESVISIIGVWNDQLRSVHFDWTGQQYDNYSFSLPDKVTLPLRSFGYDVFLDHEGTVFQVNPASEGADSLMTLPELEEVFSIEGMSSSFFVGLTGTVNPEERNLLDLTTGTPTVLFTGSIFSVGLTPFQGFTDEARVQVTTTEEILEVSSFSPHEAIHYVMPGYYLNKSLVEAVYFPLPLFNMPSFLRLFKVLDSGVREIILETNSSSDSVFNVLFSSSAGDSIHSLMPLFPSETATDSSDIEFTFVSAGSELNWIHWFNGTEHDSLCVNGEVGKLRYLQAIWRQSNPNPLDQWTQTVSAKYLIWDEYDAISDSTEFRCMVTGIDTVLTRSLREHGHSLPAQFILHTPWPNPFNGSTTISFAQAHASVVRVTVSDLLGREVARLVDGESSPGIHQVQWRPASTVATGTYIVRLDADGQQFARRITLLK